MKFVRQYVKKPVVVEAVKFEYTNECISFLKEWMGDAYIGCSKHRSPNAVGWLEFWCISPDYPAVAKEGDYIIKGNDGTFNACKPHIFEDTHQLTTYELVNYVMGADE